MELMVQCCLIYYHHTYGADGSMLPWVFTLLESAKSWLIHGGQSPLSHVENIEHPFQGSTDDFQFLSLWGISFPPPIDFLKRGVLKELGHQFILSHELYSMM